MTTFARLINGYALDCQTAATAQELAIRFHPEWLAANPFTPVPDGTIHGAKDNGNGTFSNPPAPVPVVYDFILLRADFIDHCIAQFGGVSRFGSVMSAAKTATDGTVAAYYEKYTSLSSVTKAQAQAFFTAARAANLPAGSVVSIAEITAVVANWPKG